jgi:hypothetical protein
MKVIRGAVQTTPELLQVLESLRYRSVPKWLGLFRFHVYKLKEGDLSGLPALIRAEVTKLMTLAEPQEWNTVFVQHYFPGEGVLPHRDPKNNLDHTVIGLYGENYETALRVDMEWAAQHPGDVFVLPCTLAGKQGPIHEMRWPEDCSAYSDRYAIVLNRIVD